MAAAQSQAKPKTAPASAGAAPPPQKREMTEHEAITIMTLFFM